jgi:hypothetical protein
MPFGRKLKLMKILMVFQEKGHLKRKANVSEVYSILKLRKSISQLSCN